MSILDIKSGKREYMTLQAYEDYFFNNVIGDEYQVMINPDTFERRFTASYEKPKSILGKYSISSGLFSGMGTTTYNFSLILDGTGIVNPAKKDVKKELDDLMNVLFTKWGDGGRCPNYVIITYCHETFRCVVTSVVVKYTLFNPDGTPLRATVTCSFSSADRFTNQSDMKKKISENEKSWFEDFSEVISSSVKNECDSLYNLLAIK
jgi:hypothetical protein